MKSPDLRGFSLQETNARRASGTQRVRIVVPSRCRDHHEEDTVTPRKATLRVAHQGNCPKASKTSLDSLRGCKCAPSYYVMHRDTSGATRKSARVKDRRLADKMLREKQVEIDKGHAGYQEQKSIAFPE